MEQPAGENYVTITNQSSTPIELWVSARWAEARVLADSPIGDACTVGDDEACPNGFVCLGSEPGALGFRTVSCDDFGQARCADYDAVCVDVGSNECFIPCQQEVGCGAEHLECFELSDPVAGEALCAPRSES